MATHNYRVIHQWRKEPFLLGLVVVGAALRLWQYAGNASLEIDELALSRGIIDHPLGTLPFTPLPYGQAAPWGFLLTEKLAVMLFGQNEYALRLLPLLCALASLVLLWRVAKRVLRGLAVPFALALFAFSPTFILYASTVKQYSVDITAALLLTLMAFELRCQGTTWRRCLLSGLVGAAIVQFSQPAAFVLVGIGFALLCLTLAERDYGSLRSLLMMIALWGGGAVVAVAMGLQNITPATAAYFHLYWKNGFMPTLWLPKKVAFWLWWRLYDMFNLENLHSALYAWPSVYVGLAALGTWSLWRRCRDVLLILLGPLSVTLAASMAHQYPFQGRLVLFLAPSFLLAAAEGAEWVGRVWRTRPSAAGAITLVLLAIPPMYDFATSLPVYRREETKPVLAYMQAQRLPDDVMYVYYGAWQAVSFYGARYGFWEGEYVIGGCHVGDLRAYLRELDAFRGQQRVWVMFSHAVPRLQELPTMVGYLDRIGIRQDSLIVPGRFWHNGPSAADVYIYLYDLSDEARLASASADTYLLPSTSVTRLNPYWGCVAGPQVPIANSTPH